MVEVRQCSFLEVGAFKELPALVDEYAAESAIGGLPTPHYVPENYLPLERAGVAQLIIATNEDRLIGFVVVIVTINPRYDVPVAAFEVFFVGSEYRKGGAGMLLKRAAEETAKAMGAIGIFAGAPIGGRLEQILDRCSGYRETNRVFFKSLVDE